jgi:hypothetical protein
MPQLPPDSASFDTTETSQWQNKTDSGRVNNACAQSKVNGLSVEWCWIKKDLD